MTYDEEVGLFLNADRVRLWHAMATLDGVRMAFSRKAPPRAWHDAVAPLEESVGEAERLARNAAEEARVTGRP